VPPKKWVSEAARKHAYRDRLKGVDRPASFYNTTARKARVDTRYVYVIEAAETGHLKIGLARDPASRVRELQTGSPVELLLIGQVPAGPAFEALLHRRFDLYRVRGEWFSPAIREPLVALLDVLDHRHWPPDLEEEE